MRKGKGCSSSKSAFLNVKAEEQEEDIEFL